MVIEKLQFSNIRNLGNNTIYPSPTLNFIVGSNGSGKSSLIEAISLITTARSFRTQKSSRIVTSNKTTFTLFAKIASEITHYSVGIHRDNIQNQFRIRINQENIGKASILASYFPQLTISPEQCDLIDGSPERRRSFIDWSLFHVKHDYHEQISNYRKALAQRNSALRRRDGSTLEHWDSVLCLYAEQIDSYRVELFKQIKEILNQDIGSKFNIELDLKRININYHSGWKRELTLKESLVASRIQDLERGFTHQGPHRADFRIIVDSVPVKEFLSRGEKKILQILLTVAQMLQVREQNERTPIILMDDIFSELDHHNIEFLFNLIREMGLQLFVTATDLIDIEKFIKPGEKLFHVKRGIITEVV